MTLHFSSSNASYAIVPATPDDIPSIVDVLEDAYDSDSLMRKLKAGIERDEWLRRQEKSHNDAFSHSRLTGARYLTAVETATGKVVGYAGWDFPVQLNDAEKAEKQALMSGAANEPPPPGANTSLATDFWEQVGQKRGKHCDPERDICLVILAVHSSHYRRGIGSMLLAYGLAHADRLGAKIYLHASPMGQPLYKRHGWDMVDQTIVDFGRHGISGGRYTNACMLRHPKTPDLKCEMEEAQDIIAGDFGN